MHSSENSRRKFLRNSLLFAAGAAFVKPENTFAFSNPMSVFAFSLPPFRTSH
jgi:hypothetical protein